MSDNTSEDQMTSDERLKEDIAYVRAAAERSDGIHVRAHGFLWAAIVLCGFSIADFVEDPRWIGRYWMVASPVGFILSAWLSARAEIRAGQVDRAKGRRWLLHWLAFLAAGVLGVMLFVRGHMAPEGIGSLWVLLLALTYFHAGVHLDRRLLPIGILAAGGYLITLFVPQYGWTLTGVLVASALVAHALLGTPRRAPAS